MVGKDGCADVIVTRWTCTTVPDLPKLVLRLIQLLYSDLELSLSHLQGFFCAGQVLCRPNDTLVT